MKTLFSSPIGPTNVILRNSLAWRRTAAAGLLLIAGVVAAAAQAHLNPGDIVYLGSASIVKVDPQTGQATFICQGGLLGNFGYSVGVVVDRAGQLIIANRGCLLRLDPDTCEQTLIRDAQDAPGFFSGIALDQDGSLLVAAEAGILRVNPDTGAMRVISSGGFFTQALSLAVGKHGELFVINNRFEAAGGGWVGEIIRVHPQNGQQKLIARGGYLNYLQGIAVAGDDIYVTGMATQDKRLWVGRVTHVDARTGAQRLVSQDGRLVCPVGIAVNETGRLIVADPFTMSALSLDPFAGAIIGVEPATGAQMLVMDAGAYWSPVLNPCGVALVPSLVPSRKR